MNVLPIEKRAQILNLLIEGNSMRATSRLADCSINTVTKLLVDVGPACSEYQDKAMRNLTCKRIQCDEIWSFCYSKERNVPKDLKGIFGYGDVWTWTAIDADTKLIISHLVGQRNAACAAEFIEDLSGHVHGIPQVTTDGLKLYVSPIRESFGELVDYAMLVKIYGEPEAGTEVRYSPSKIIGCQATPIMGYPDPKHISTSFVERQNLTIRMMNRRFTRLTNAFSKKIENHMHAFTLYAFHYNFVRVHQTLRVTPAMESKLTDHVWSLEEMVGLLEAQERKAIESGAMKRGHYRVKDSD